MSSAKKKKSISDQINEILKPKELTEEADEIEAKFEEFTETGDRPNQLSDIRRQTARSLSELDSKYKGKVVSRKQLEAEEDPSEDPSEDEADQKYASGSDEDVESEYDEDGEDSEGGEEESDDELGSEDDYDDDGLDLSQFTKSKQSFNSTSEDKTQLLKTSSLNEEIQKGVCVQNQLKIWEKLLEVRIKSQKMLITANSLPDFDAQLELTSLDDSAFAERVEITCDSLHGLLDNFLELQSTLVNRWPWISFSNRSQNDINFFFRYPESKDIFASLKRKKDQTGSGSFLKKSKLAEYSDRIEGNHSSYKGYRDKVLQKWHERTKTAKDLKNPAANVNIVTKIENALLRKNEMIKKTQIFRGDHDIYGVERPQPNDDGTLNEIELPEIFDDSEFYHQLLRELIEYKSNTDENQSEITQKFIELQKVRSKMKKKVDTRASKGRKIRYIVHNKLVNFMPAKDTSEFTDEAKTELYNSLFGMANHGTTTTTV